MYEYRFGKSSIERHSLDSTISDYLKSSPYTGYCANTAMYDHASISLYHLYEKNKQMGRVVDSMTKVRYARDIAAGLASLHNINDVNDTAMAVYLDLKPENVVVINGRVLLSDFNAAAMIMQSTGDSNEELCPLNSRGPYVEGALFYPPEKNQHFTEKVDIYDLGGMIHYLLIGLSQTSKPLHQPWYHDDHRPNHLLKPEEVDELYTSNDDPLIQALLTVARKSHHFDPGERPHAKDIVKYLDSVLAGKSIE